MKIKLSFAVLALCFAFNTSLQAELRQARPLQEQPILTLIIPGNLAALRKSSTRHLVESSLTSEGQRLYLVFDDGFEATVSCSGRLLCHDPKAIEATFEGLNRIKEQPLMEAAWTRGYNFSQTDIDIILSNIFAASGIEPDRLMDNFDDLMQNLHNFADILAGINIQIPLDRFRIPDIQLALSKGELYDLAAVHMDVEIGDMATTAEVAEDDSHSPVAALIEAIIEHKKKDESEDDDKSNLGKDPENICWHCSGHRHYALQNDLFHALNSNMYLKNLLLKYQQNQISLKTLKSDVNELRFDALR